MVVAVVAALGCREAPRPPVGERLDALFGDLHARGLFDGAVVVGDARGVIWERGYGHADVARGVPFTPDTPTDGASLAKTFTAALAIELAGEGVVDLDAPARRWLPELPYEDVTLRHLLGHASGLPILDYDWFDPHLPPGKAVRTTEALLGVIATQRPALAASPGTAFEYSSLGFDLVALALARAGGAPYVDLLEDRFFRPLGITSAFARPAWFRDFPGTRTLGYRREGGELVPNEVFDGEAFHGGSNLYISARDLHRWNAAFLGDRPPLDPAGSAQAHELARIGDGTSGLTLGSWYRAPDGSAFWYSGHLQGFHAEVFRDARAGWSIVYVSNNTLEPWLQKAIVRAVRRVLAGDDVPPLRPPALDELPGDRSALAGEWRLPGEEPLAIRAAADHVSMERAGVSYRMVPIGPRVLYVPGLDLLVGVDAGGLHVESNLAERRASR